MATRAIPLASRSYAQARLGHIDRGKERRGTPRATCSKTQRNYTTRTCKVPASTTRRLIVCTPWHIVRREAFGTTARETLLVVLRSENRKEAREPGDDANCRQSQADRKSYIAHSRDPSSRSGQHSHRFVRTIHQGLDSPVRKECETIADGDSSSCRTPSDSCLAADNTSEINIRVEQSDVGQCHYRFLWRCRAFIPR